MQKPGEKKKLASVVNDASRKITIRGSQAIVPLKYDKDGNPVQRIQSQYLKRLTLDDLRFLKAWKESDWNLDAAVKKTNVSQERALHLAKKLQVFREEDAITRSLAEIPTPSWIAARHVENVLDGGQLEDSEQKSLQELAKIQGAYKNTSTQINIQQNFLQRPTLSPEQEKEVRQIFDTIAIQGEAAA